MSTRHNTTVHLPPTTRDALDDLAQRERRTRSNLIEVLIAEALSLRGLRLDEQPERGRAAALVG